MTYRSPLQWFNRSIFIASIRGKGNISGTNSQGQFQDGWWWFSCRYGAFPDSLHGWCPLCILYNEHAQPMVSFIFLKEDRRRFWTSGTTNCRRWLLHVIRSFRDDENMATLPNCMLRRKRKTNQSWRKKSRWKLNQDDIAWQDHRFRILYCSSSLLH